MSQPTVEQFLRADSTPLYALLRWPLIHCTREFMEDSRWQFSWWYRKAYTDIDREIDVYAVLPLIPVLRTWKRWQRHRWDVERWLIREGVLVCEKGAYLRDAHGHQVFR